MIRQGRAIEVGLLPRTYLAALFAAASFFAQTATVDALPVTYSYTLDITKISDQTGASPFELAAGVQIRGSFLIETDTVDSKAGNDSVGKYNQAISESSFSFDWNGGAYASGPAERSKFAAQIRDAAEGDGKDKFLFRDKSRYAGLGDFNFNLLRLNLVDRSGSVFADDMLPDRFDLSDFDRPSFMLRFKNGSEKLIYRGTVTSLFAQTSSGPSFVDTTPVPLPSSLPALASAFGLAGAAAWRQRRKLRRGATG